MPITNLLKLLKIREAQAPFLSTDDFTSYVSRPIINPLDLPEVREALAPFLSTDDITRCVRVCKTWHLSFFPFLGASFEIPSDQDNQQSLSYLQQHRDFVKRLIYHGKVPTDHKNTRFPALRILHLLCLSLVKVPKVDPGIHIISNHPALTHLKLRGSLPSAPLSPWRLPTNMGSLINMSLTGIVLHAHDFNAFWAFWSQLETLELCYSEMPYGLWVPAQGNWKMRDLTVMFTSGLDPRKELAWIRRCSNLERLRWCSSALPQHFPINEIAQLVVDKTWPKLQDLSLVRSGASDMQVATIVGGMQRVLGISIPCSDFDQAWTSLRLHFPWLKHLDVWNNRTDTTDLVLEVLKSCPRLQTLRANRMFAREFQEEEAPWACERSLKTLEVCFRVSYASEGTEQRILMERISRLYMLERLDISNQEDSPGSVFSLQFSLGKGLEQLATLTSLKELVVEYTEQKMTGEDVAWMIRSWKNLKSVDGLLNTDDLVGSYDLITAFSKAGIEAKRMRTYRTFVW